MLRYCLLLLAVLPLAGEAAEYSSRPLLAAPVSVADDTVTEVQLPTPVSRRQEMAQLDIRFSTGTKVRYSFESGGIGSARGAASLLVTLVADDGKKYGADIVTGDFYPNGVQARFVTLPPRKTPLRKLLLRGRNLPPIEQIYWLEGREKLATGVDEDLAHCEEGKCRWREAMDYCRSRGGRLLTLAELKTMYFDVCAGKECRVNFWSSTEYAQFPRNAWYVDFSDGKGVSALKTYSANVRCMVPAGAAYKSKK